MKPLLKRRRLLVKIAALSFISACCCWLFININLATTTDNHLVLDKHKSMSGKGGRDFSSPKKNLIAATGHKLKIPDTKDVIQGLEMFYRSKTRPNLKASDVKRFTKTLVKFYDLKDPQNKSIDKNAIDLSSVKEHKHSSVSKMKHSNESYKYYLSAIIMVRIYKTDLAKWTIRELKQWMHYLFYSGVEHIYLCDHYVLRDERLRDSLSTYIQKGLLTYIDWPWNASINGGAIMSHQVKCYSQVVQTSGKDSKWLTSIDMDEYPFCPKDFHPKFLSNYLKRKESDEEFSSVSQVLMENFLMLGQGDRKRTMVIERINRITKKIANKLTKPIFKSSDTSDIGIHTHYFKTGRSIHANIDELIMLHYWGARLQNWSSDTEETLRITDKFNSVAIHVAPLIRKSLISFGETAAFSNVSGP